MATLLLIDPNPATRSLLKTLMTGAGYRVESVGSVIAARGVISRTLPDLTLVDLGHPRAAETFRGLAGLGVPAHTVVLMASPEDLETLGRPDLSNSPQVLDRAIPDEALVAEIARRLTVPEAAPPFMPTPTKGGATDSQAAPSGPMPSEYAPPAMITPPGEELQSLYKDVGIDLPTSRRTLLYCDLHRLGDVTGGLVASEQDDVLATLLRKLEQAIITYDGRVCVATRNGFAVLFDLDGGGSEADARPFQAGIEMVYIAQQFGGWLRHRFPGRGRQDVAIAIALDTGDFDMEEGIDAPLDPDLKRVIARAAQYATLGGQHGWTLTATADAMATASQTCSAGESIELGGADAVTLFEVGAVALDSTTSVHERIARIFQSNSSLLRHGGANATAQRDLAEPSGAGNQAGLEQPTNALGNAIQGTTHATSGETTDSFAGSIEIPGYRVLRPLGKGGMAEVFLATHLATGQERVLKLLPINDGEEEQLQRFIQEYALISQIRDPNVAQIHEQGFTQSHAYIAMEFLPGGELRAAMKGAIETPQALAWVQAIAGALKAVHAKDITHRDLKPANLMFRADGSLVLADFGIAKSQSDLLNRTASGHIVGSPYYLSPEQAESRPVDARCDLYSLGIILFEMLTGKKPFRASNLSDLIRQHVIAPIPRLPDELATFQPVIDRLLAKSPSDRLASAEHVLDALRGLQPERARGMGNSSRASETPAGSHGAALRDVYSVAVIGFDDTEKIVLSSTLGLSIRRKPRFIEFDASRSDRPDLYLVDARDLLYLQTMLASNLDRAVPTVLIGSSDFGTGWQVLKRPLQWTKVFEAFDRALREHEAVRNAVPG